jgi:hypothetical protein
MKSASLLIAAITIVALAGVSRAQTLFTGTPSDTQDIGSDAQTTFTVIGDHFEVGGKTLRVTSLGFYASTGALQQSHDVGLFDMTGTLVGPTVTVNSSTPVVGGYAFAPLSSPVTLLAGHDYILAASSAQVPVGTADLYSALPAGNAPIINTTDFAPFNITVGANWQYQSLRAAGNYQVYVDPVLSELAGLSSLSLPNPPNGEPDTYPNWAAGSAFYWGANAYVGPNMQYSLPIAGDINGDGLVDVADYNIWAANVGKTGATWAEGDLNGDGLVDVADYNIWAANVGRTSATPEPISMIILAVGGGLMALKRRNG